MTSCRLSNVKFNFYSLSDKVFQHRRFASRLSSHDGDLGQVDDHGYSELREGILHPIDHRNEGFHAPISNRRRHFDALKFGQY